MDLEKFSEEAMRSAPSNKVFLKGLKKKKIRNLDDRFHQLHNEVFEEVDCLSCANCCKTTSPIFYEPDISRAAKALKMKVSDFIATYLKLDEEQDYVLRNAPCPFLSFDNTCIIYEHRPRACREYPHTNRKRMFQILDLTLKNTMVCPATLEIVKRLHKQMELTEPGM